MGSFWMGGYHYWRRCSASQAVQNDSTGLANAVFNARSKGILLSIRWWRIRYPSRARAVRCETRPVDEDDDDVDTKDRHALLSIYPVQERHQEESGDVSTKLHV